jgi:hypothetical protein
MAPEGSRNPAQTVAIALLFVVIVFLGLRTYQVARAVLGGWGDAAGMQEVPRTRDVLGETIVTKDSLLASARPAERNPLGDPPRRRTRTRTPPPPVEVKSVIPELGALLYDTVAPMIQLKTGSSVSGWLHQGEVFQGWTVTEIQPRSATIKKGDHQVTLVP